MVASRLYFLERFEEGCGYLEQRDAGGWQTATAWGPSKEGSRLDGRITGSMRKSQFIPVNTALPKAGAPKKCLLRCFSAFLEEMDRTRGKSGCGQGSRKEIVSRGNKSLSREVVFKEATKDEPAPVQVQCGLY